MSRSVIPFSLPSIGDEEILDVVDCLRSGWITTGPRAAAFEREFAAYVDAPHAAAVSSATAGLHLLMIVLNLQPGDEVITTPMTWPATVNAIVLAGGKPVLADVEPETLNLSVAEVERLISARTRAVVPVHFAGQPCDLDALLALTRDRGIRLIEDAAHAIGTEYRGRRIGGHGDAAVFSFHPIKNMTTGEGGMVTTADEEMLRALELVRFHGVERDAWKAYGSTQLPHYDVSTPGLKYNMTDIQAAIGSQQLRKLESFIERRTLLARRYDEALAALPEIQPLGHVTYPMRHAHHLYVVRMKSSKVTREEVMTHLVGEGIGVGLHFLAIHELTYYRDRLGDLRSELPIATEASRSIFSLPLYPSLTEDQQDRVVSALQAAVA